MICKREKYLDDGIIGQMIGAEVDGAKLNLSEGKATMTSLSMAGVGSFSGFLSMMALNLADYLLKPRELAANTQHIPGAVEEFLGYNAPAKPLRPVLLHELDVLDDLLDIHRNPKGHLGFGGAVHFTWQLMKDSRGKQHGESHLHR
ncbi:MAG: hypothetical protein PVI97_03580 [Candidatus Thiodiazotropha sp.]|jgi:cytochrome P450